MKQNMKYVKANKCWNFMGHTFLRFDTIPLFFNYVIIEGEKYEANRCYGGPPFSIDISGEYNFKNLNVGFMEPPEEERKRMTQEAIRKIDEVLGHNRKNTGNG